MQKVYILRGSPMHVNHWEIYAVYATEELAKAAAKRVLKKGIHTDIDEFYVRV